MRIDFRYRKFLFVGNTRPVEGVAVYVKVGHVEQTAAV
jgi:hypothetical protein